MAIATFVRGRSGGRARGFVWLGGRARRSVEVVLSRWIDAVAVLLSPSSFSVGGDFVVHEMVLSDCV